jgi:hypothetical protein
MAKNRLIQVLRGMTAMLRKTGKKYGMYVP